jgi:hypothetical protein
LSGKRAGNRPGHREYQSAAPHRPVPGRMRQCPIVSVTGFLMRLLLHLAYGVLQWTANPGEAPDRRPIGTDGEALFRVWAESYRRALVRPDPWEGLVELGRQMYRWLDGDSGWLGRARERGVTQPWIVSSCPSLVSSRREES